jgi:uncharacterized spore protein YtfJ
MQEAFQSIIDRAGAKLVFGDPVSANGKTILPVATIRYAFGGGSGKKAGTDESGGGGGGALVARPVGIVEVTEAETRFIPITSPWKIPAALLIGVVLGFLVVPKQVNVRVDKRA